LLDVTIAKLPLQNFSQVVWFKLLLRDISSRAFFFISGVTFDLRVSVDISFLNTYVNGDMCSEDGQSVYDNKIVVYSATVAKRCFFVIQLSVSTN